MDPKRSRGFSQNFLESVAQQVSRLKKASEDSGADLTQDLIKTLNQLSEISKYNNSDSSFSSESEDLSKSLILPQPTNSRLSLSSIDSKKSFITSIKNKNSELQKACSQKILELRSTTKEFCNANSPATKQRSLGTEPTAELTKTGRARSYTCLAPVHSLMPESTFDDYLGQLSQIKKDISRAQLRIIQNNHEITKQNTENFKLRNELEKIIEEHATSKPDSCGCLVF